MRIYLALFAAAVAATAAPNNPVEAGTDLFCYEGHQLPSLFVIGAPKCGTTSLFGELIANWEFRAYTFPGKRCHRDWTLPNATYTSDYPCGGVHGARSLKPPLRCRSAPAAHDLLPSQTPS